MSRFCVLLMGCSITDLRRNLSTNARRDLPAITSVTCVSRACHVHIMSKVANCSTNVGAVELHDFDIHLFELDAASARVDGGSASYCARRRKRSRFVAWKLPTVRAISPCAARNLHVEKCRKLVLRLAETSSEGAGRVRHLSTSRSSHTATNRRRRRRFIRA